MKAKFKPERYFSLYFLLSWVPLWLLALSDRQQWRLLSNLFLVLAGLGAPLAAIIMVYMARDRDMAQDYWDRLFDFRRIKPAWWPVIVLLMPALMAAAVLISTLFREPLAQFRFAEDFLFSPLTFLIWYFFFGPLPEEMGLRGYGIDSLTSRTNLLKASLLLAAIWSLWHVPLFFWRDSYQSRLLDNPSLLVVFLANLISSTFLTNWIYYRNNRSTLAAVTFHYTTNLSGEIIRAGDQARIIQEVLALLVMLAVVLVDRDLFLNKLPGPRAVR